jgi:hypothetical protein
MNSNKVLTDGWAKLQRKIEQNAMISPFSVSAAYDTSPTVRSVKRRRGLRKVLLKNIELLEEYRRRSVVTGEELNQWSVLHNNYSQLVLSLSQSIQDSEAFMAVAVQEADIEYLDIEAEQSCLLGGKV